MSIEPERPIEKLLRAYGKKRRDEAGAPFELHPVGRRELQSEVSRRYGASAPQTGFVAGFLARFWPRLVLVSACAMLVLVAGGILLNRETRHGSGTIMAKKDSVLRPDMVPQTEAPKADQSVASRQRALVPAPTPPATAAAPPAARESQPPATESLEKGRLESAPSNDRDQRRLQSQLAATPSNSPTAAPSMREATKSIAMAPAAPAAPAPRRDVSNRVDGMALPALDKTNEMALAYRQLNSFPATNVTRYGPFAPVSGLQLAARVADQQAFMRQQGEAPGTSPTAPAGPPGTGTAVLVSFRMEQSGRQLRVIDSDGSIYSGYVVAAALGSEIPRLAEDSSMSNAAASASASLLTNTFDFSGTVPPGEFSFRVSGTNLTLNQYVVFAGDLTGPSNAPALLAESAASASGATESSPARGGGFGGGGRGGMGGAGGFGGGALGGGMGVGGRLAGGAGRGGGRGGRAAGRESISPASSTNQPIVVAPAQAARPSPSPMPNIRIAGKVTIGTGKEADIEALAPALPSTPNLPDQGR
jgi:hypothetical protein